MSGLNIKKIQKKTAPNRNPFKNSTPYDKRFGFWGVVTAVNSEKNCVDVCMDTGEELLGVRVASMEWATYAKEPEGKQPELSGERHLPPKGTYVFCLMPTGCVEDAFVLCSAFAKSEALHGYFKQKDKESEWERIENSGWRCTTDYKTGTKKITNTPNPDDATISLEIDQESEGEEKATLTIHGNVFKVTKDGVEFSTDGTVKQSVKGDVARSTEGNLEETADGNVELSATKDGTLKFGNSVDTLGNLISTLIDEVIALKTYGSPYTHNVDPSSVMKLNKLKTQWEKVFKK